MRVNVTYVLSTAPDGEPVLEERDASGETTFAWVENSLDEQSYLWLCSVEDELAVSQFIGLVNQSILRKCRSSY